MMASVGWDARRWNGNSKEHRDATVRRYVEEFPDVSHIPVALVSVIDCTDPHHDPNLRSHSGYHPDTMFACAKNMTERSVSELAWLLESFREGEKYAKLVVVLCCRRARHRSIAIRELFQEYVKRHHPEFEVHDGPATRFSGRMCCESTAERGTCTLCAHAEKREVVCKAHTIFQSV